MRSYYCKATYLMNNGDLKQALVFAQKAESMLKDFHNVDMENRIFKLFMTINYNSKNYRKALIYGHKILDNGLKTGDFVVVSEMYNNFHAIYSDKDEKDSADFYVQKCRETLSKIPRKDRTGILSSIAASYLERNDYKQARRFVLEDIAIKKTVYSTYILGGTYFVEGNYAKADSLFDVALPQADSGLKMGILKAKAELYRRMGEYSKASAAAKALNQMSDTLEKKQKREELLSMQDSYDKEQDRKEASRVVVWIVAGALAAIGGLAGVAVWLRRRDTQSRRLMVDGKAKIERNEACLKELEAQKSEDRLKIEALQRSIAKIRERENDMLGLGKQRLDEIDGGGNIALWKRSDIEAAIEYYRIEHADRVKQIEDGFSRLTANQLFYLILLDRGLNESEVQTIMVMRDGAFRTMKSRIAKQRK